MSLAAGLAILSYPAPPAASVRRNAWTEWTQQSFQDFSKGTFGTGGANIYVTAKGRIQLINRWDLNQDGYSDLFFGNTHDTRYVEPVWIYYQGKTTPLSLPSRGGYRIYAADLNRDGYLDLVVGNSDNNISTRQTSYVYWNSASGFVNERRTQLWTEGVSGIAAGDLDSDGYTDLVFANTEGGSSFIYWGGPEGPSDNDRTDLPTYEATDVAVADLNADGLLDLVFANRNGRGGGSSIYWGNRQRFTRLQRTVLQTQQAVGVAAADLNGDGHPELVFANWGRAKGGAHIYWGGAGGYSVARRTSLPAAGVYGISVADLDGDGYPELIFPCGISGEHVYGLREYRHNTGEVGQPPSLIYWGGRSGYSPGRRTELPTVAATSAAAGDYNGDGRVDVAVVQLYREQQFETESLLFMGTEQGLDLEHPLHFKTRGATDLAMADLDDDGKLDLAFANKMNGNPKGTVPSYVYWGGPQGYSAANRLELPSSGANEGKFADFDADGWTDVLVCNQDHDDRTLRTGSSIFWGGPKGVSASRFTRIDVDSAWASSVADLNKDGYLDIVISAWDETRDSLFVYWGGPQGYSSGRRTVLPQRDSRQNLVADLNEDGYLDVVAASYLESDVKIFWGGPKGFSGKAFQSLHGLGPVGVETADLNGDGYADIVVCNFGASGSEGHPVPSYIYWGGRSGFSAKSREELPTMTAHDAAVGDLNGDGDLDLVFSNYRSRDSRIVPAYVYWGSSNGFDAHHRSLLPARGAAGLLVADLNRDAILDVVFANHSDDQGDHKINSMVLWGSPHGYHDASTVTWLPTLGVHNMLSVDVGNRLTRKMEEEYLSLVHHTGFPISELQLSWEGEYPHGTRLRFQIRSATSPHSLRASPWRGPGGGQDYFDSPGEALTISGRGESWLQYRVLLTTPDGAATPVLRKVEVRYR